MSFDYWSLTVYEEPNLLLPPDYISPDY